MWIFDVNGVQAERKALRVSQVTLAKMAGVGTRGLSGFERKIGRLPTDKVRRIQTALHICQVVAFQADPPFDWAKLGGDIRYAVDQIEHHAKPSVHRFATEGQT